jgi:NADH-quinone oxidoreductase subunit H
MTQTELIFTLLVILIVVGGLLTAGAYLILLERKVSAWVQDRLGPNRVGFDLGQPELKKVFGGFRFWGLGQPLADGLKFLFKEQMVPDHVNKALYFIGPSIAVFTTMLAFAIVPFGPTSVGAADTESFRFVIAPNVDIGILFVFAIGSLAVYAVILGGWASNNKYSFLGALRSSAQIISYEIPLGMSILGVVLMAGSLNLEKVIAYQTIPFSWSGGGWFIFYQPLAWLIFLTAAMAESNRMPFDLPECEQELIGGYHTEYSGMKFVMFFLGEYTHVVTISFLMAIFFFGGWHFPWIAEPGNIGPGWAAVKVLVLLAKVFLFIMLIMLLRWTLPRFRFDQLMSVAWKVLIPLAFLNLFCVMIVKEFNLPPLLLLPASIGVFILPAALVEAPFAKRPPIPASTSEPPASTPPQSGGDRVGAIAERS